MLMLSIFYIIISIAILVSIIIILVIFVLSFILIRTPRIIQQGRHLSILLVILLFLFQFTCQSRQFALLRAILAYSCHALFGQHCPGFRPVHSNRLFQGGVRRDAQQCHETNCQYRLGQQLVHEGTNQCPGNGQWFHDQYQIPID